MKILSGIVTGDPAPTASVGTAVKMEFRLFVPAIEKGAGALEEWDHFGSALCMISFTDGATYRADGSAVLIGPGLALAARHVFDPILDDLKAGYAAPNAISLLPEGLMIWRIAEIILGDTDVVLLRLDLLSDFPASGFAFAELTTRTPEVGEPVMIVGCRAEKAVEIGANLPIEVRVGVGEVVQVHDTGRDSVLLPHPCFGVGCLTIGGMSGGPAFDKSGRLLGVLSSSIEHEEGPSYVSFWWPVGGDTIESSWLPGLFETPTTLMGLSAKRLVSIERPEALTFTNERNQRKVYYESWS